MKQRRVEFLLMLAVLFAVNAFMLLWLQVHPIPTALASVLGAPVAAPQAVAIPSTFSYQGTLRDANGNLINGTVKLTLGLYGAVTGGSTLYTETFPTVNVRAGVFSVVVGDAQALPASVFTTFPLYLGLSVNNDAEMLPRQRLHPVPYAMQATNAQTAVTANNLVQGGGVPNLVTIGAGGASEIAFLPNGGKVTSDANGLTLNGGANSSVTTAGALNVGGDLTVDGNWSVNAIRDVGDSHGGLNKRSTYPVNLGRYVVEAPDAGTAPNSVPIDDAILRDFCADIDGCRMRIYARDYNDGVSTDYPGILAGPGGTVLLSVSPIKNNRRFWSIHNDSAGMISEGYDGDNNSSWAWSIYNSSCGFTDAAYTNNQPNDSALGFGLVNGSSGDYQTIKMTCVLIIED